MSHIRFTLCSNKIFNGFVEVGVFPAVVTVQSNRIVNATHGIEFVCIADENVQSNTIAGANAGVDPVPAAVITTNSYFNVVTERTAGCP